MKIKGAKAVHYESGPNMTPLVDVVMVILIFLMLTGSFGAAAHFMPSSMPIKPTIVVETADTWYVYKVNQTEIVLPEGSRIRRQVEPAIERGERAAHRRQLLGAAALLVGAALVTARPDRGVLPQRSRAV